jgi:2-C-methyl-D-erythritol 4-phosphate cytidylyltransferase
MLSGGRASGKEERLSRGCARVSGDFLKSQRKNLMENRTIKCTAVMLAAGFGRRMGTDIKKQYLMLGGMPMFLHSIRTMQESRYITDIIVMVHKDDVEVVRELLEEYGLTEKLRRIAPGGKERVHSVALGLEAVDWPCDYVFIHDCARPFLDQETLFRLFETVQKTSACCAGVPSKDTVKIVDENCDVSKTPNRANVWIVQTPQVFSLDLIRNAHRKALAEEDYLLSQGIILTDDAMVAELAGNCKVRMVMADYRNIKITTPEDLIIGEAFLKN